MSLSPIASEAHATEAIRLFLTSTLAAATQSSPEVTEEVKKIEASLRKRLPIGFQASYRMLIREYVNGVCLLIKSKSNIILAWIFTTRVRNGFTNSFVEGNNSTQKWRTNGVSIRSMKFSERTIY